MSPSDPVLPRRGDDVAVVGNVFLDRVYDLPGWPRRGRTNVATAAYDGVGGVGNVARRLRALDPECRLGLRTAVGDDLAGAVVRQELRLQGLPTAGVEVVADASTTSATILVDSARAERASIVAWGACSTARHRLAVAPAWCHVAYLDACRGIGAGDLRALREAGSVVSADLCLAALTDADRSRLVDLLGAVDHLIIAETECRALAGGILPADVRRLGHLVHGAAIVHHEGGSLWSNGRALRVTTAPPDPGVRDVLGAGDAFAAGYIHCMRTGSSIDAAIAAAHGFATEFLKVRA